MFSILNADLRIVLFLAFLPFIGIGHCRQEAKMGLGKVHELGLELGTAEAQWCYTLCWHAAHKAVGYWRQEFEEYFVH